MRDRAARAVETTNHASISGTEMPDGDKAFTVVTAHIA